MAEEEKASSSESPRIRFIRTAERRVNQALDDIRIVGKLSSERYEYGPDDVRHIIDALTGAVENCRIQLENRPSRQTKVFSIVSDE